MWRAGFGGVRAVPVRGHVSVDAIMTDADPSGLACSSTLMAIGSTFNHLAIRRCGSEP